MQAWTESRQPISWLEQIQRARPTSQDHGRDQRSSTYWQRNKAAISRLRVASSSIYSVVRHWLSSIRPIISMSESTAKTMKSAFKKLLSNTARLQVRKVYSFPMWRDTKCPKLDHIIQNLTKDVKDADSNASSLQTLSFDAVAPLVFILEEAQKGTLTSQSAAGAAKAALLLLGNASAQVAKERRKKVTKNLNKNLMSLAKDSEMCDVLRRLLWSII